VDGLLVCLSQETKDRQVFSVVEKMKIPLVFFDRAFENMKFSRVLFNDKPGAADSINCIIKEGYTKIATFAGYSNTNIGKERLKGYIETLAKNKIPVKKEWIIEGGFELKDGYESFKKLINSGSLPEVIFTVNDRVALGAYKAAKEAGLNIPADIGIFGYGFNEITDFFDPQLTIINQDPRKMGQEAIKLIINEIEEGTKKGKSRILIEEEFLWRKSVKRKMGKLNK
jgi:DNA-binding LacI/PurR family transcriptional regulator